MPWVDSVLWSRYEEAETGFFVMERVKMDLGREVADDVGGVPTPERLDPLVSRESRFKDTYFNSLVRWETRFQNDHFTETLCSQEVAR